VVVQDVQLYCAARAQTLQSLQRTNTSVTSDECCGAQAAPVDGRTNVPGLES